MKYFDQARADKLLESIKAVTDWDDSRPDSFWNKEQSESELAELKAWWDSAPDATARKNYRAVMRELDAIPCRFEVGDGATSGGNGDRYPYRVIEVSKSGKSVKVQAMDYTPDLSFGAPVMGHQNWIITDNPNGAITTITLRSNGRWAAKGSSSTNGYGNFWFGAAYSYNWEF